MHSTRVMRRRLSHSLSFAELIVVAAVAAVVLVAVAAACVMFAVTVLGPPLLTVFDPLRGH